jgi:hypothetical protein
MSIPNTNSSRFPLHYDTQQCQNVTALCKYFSQFSVILA